MTGLTRDGVRAKLYSREKSYKKKPTDYQLAHATGSQADSFATPSQYDGHEETLRSEGTGETESQVSCSSCESCEGNAAAGAWIAVGSSWPSRLASATSVQASVAQAAWPLSAFGVPHGRLLHSR